VAQRNETEQKIQPVRGIWRLSAPCRIQEATVLPRLSLRLPDRDSGRSVVYTRASESDILSHALRRVRKQDECATRRRSAHTIQRVRGAPARNCSLRQCTSNHIWHIQELRERRRICPCKMRHDLAPSRALKACTHRMYSHHRFGTAADRCGSRCLPLGNTFRQRRDAR
jgi:hypothetical protein